MSNVLGFKALEKLSTIESKTASVKLRLQERKNSLYDANHMPKKWASNELDFLTHHLQTLENLDKKSQFIILLHQQHLQDSEQSFYSRHRRFSREEKGKEEKQRAEEEDDQAAKKKKKIGDETSPQVASENTWKRSGKFVLGG